MANELGIFVTNPHYMQHIMGVTRAARAKGIDVRIFFTWTGTKLAKDPQFAELCGLAKVAICADSYKKMGYDPENDIPAGLTAKEMSTQSKHGAMIDECTHYLSM